MFFFSIHCICIPIVFINSKWLIGIRAPSFHATEWDWLNRRSFGRSHKLSWTSLYYKKRTKETIVLYTVHSNVCCMNMIFGCYYYVQIKSREIVCDFMTYDLVFAKIWKKGHFSESNFFNTFKCSQIEFKKFLKVNILTFFGISCSFSASLSVVTQFCARIEFFIKL